MADKSVITNLEARVKQLIDDHRRLSELCAELTAQRETLRAEKRTLEERVRELDGELARMQLTEGLAGERGRASTVLCGRWTSASRCWGSSRQRRRPDKAAPEEEETENETKEERKWQNSR